MKLRHFAWVLGLSWGILSSAHAGTHEFQVDDDNSTALATAMTDSAGPDNPDPGPANNPGPGPAKVGGTGGDLHVSASPYFWLPGLHGTVGAFGRNANMSMSAVDLLSHIDFGLMGTAEARWNRLVLPLDLIWVRLGADRAHSSVALGDATVNLRASMFVLTPKVGVRLLDAPKIKVTFLTGIRYWHLGQTLKFSPSMLT